MKTVISLCAIFLLSYSQGIGYEVHQGPNIAFVHIGDKLPVYLKIAIRQARAFNNCDIFLVANKKAVSIFHDDLSKENVNIVFCEDLKKTSSHKSFLRRNKLDQKQKDGFWSHTTERFFYLNELIRQYNLKNVVHLENDNMLYVDIKELLPVFKNEYPTIAATFDSDDRCIAGCLYIRDGVAMAHLAKFLSSNAYRAQNDMESLAEYRKIFGAMAIQTLPIIHDTYAATYKLQSSMGHTVKDKDCVSANINAFNSIFDAAAIGQYLGGVDPYCGVGLLVGFINDSCVFNPSHLQYQWEPDVKGRKVPFAIFGGKKVRINNLHIHSKRLENFVS